MGDVLQHRGRRTLTSKSVPGFTFAFASHLTAQNARKNGVGIATDGADMLAIAGFVLGLGDARAPSPDELLTTIQREGIGVTEQLRGAWVMAVALNGVLHLIRDAVGARTIYHGHHDGRALFAVEPKALLAVSGFPRRIRPSAIAQYFTFSFVPGAATMLQDVDELEAGHRIELDERHSPPQRWFHFERQPSLDLSAEQWVARFAELHASAVAERLTVAGSDTEATVFLSGGVDSSAVVAELAAQHVGTIHTHAIHFGPPYRNELDYARAVAERCGTDHHEVEITPAAFLPRLRQAVWHMDDPIGDPITVPNFELARQVSAQTGFVFNGEGGDPLFGGPKNLTMMLHHWYGGLPTDEGFRERAYLRSYRRAYDELPRLLTPAIQSEYSASEHLEGVLRPFFAADTDGQLLHNLLAINIRLKGAHLILPKVERMLGAFGVEPLSPLFDERLVQLSFAMPGPLKLRGGVEKWVLKRAYEGRLPPSVLARKKEGMRVPVHYWFAGEMRRYVRKVLGRRALQRAGLFEPARVKQWLDYATEEGPGRYGIRLWMLLTFEIWRRIVIEREPV